MKLGHHIGIILLLLFVVEGNCIAQSKTDSLLNVVKTTPIDTIKVNALVELAYQLKNSQPDEALQYGMQAIELAEKSGFETGYVESHNITRLVYYIKKNYREAQKHGDIVYQKLVSGKNDYKKGKAAYALGNIYFKQNNYTEATNWYLRALKYYEQTDSKYDIGITQENLGSIFLQTEQLNSASEYYNKSLQTAMEIKDSIGIVSGYSNMGIVYGHLQKYTEAFEQFGKAVNLALQLKDTSMLIEVLNNEGITFKKAGRYNEAVIGYQFCEKLIKARDPVDSVALSYVYGNLGVVYTKMNQFNLAADYLQRSVDYSLKSNDNWLRSEGYNSFYELYYNRGDYKKSLDYHLKYIAIRDSMLSVEKNGQIEEMRAKYEADEKDLKIKNLDRENKANSQRQRIISYAIMGGLLLLVVIAFILYSRFLLKKKSNQKLEAANNELSKTLKDLKETQAQLIQQEKMASLGQLTAGIAHEIKNPLNFVTNFSRLSIDLVKEMETATEKERAEITSDLNINLDKIHEHAMRVDGIISGMLLHSRNSSDEKQPVDVNALCDEFANLALHSMRASGDRFNCTLTKDFAPALPKVIGVRVDLSRVLLNLCTNALYAVKKRAEAAEQNKENYQPQITIITSTANGHVKIAVKDNGTGIPRDLLEKIFMPFFTTKPSGQGTGLGLYLSYDIIKAQGGEITVTSKPGEGAEFTILLPV